MRLVCVALAIVACSKEPPAPPPVRAQAELTRQVTAFATLVHGGTLPALGDARVVRPPSEAELAWIVDRTQALAPRLNSALALFDQMRTVIHAYADRDVAAGKDSPESLAWFLANAVGNADLIDVLIDEFLPTIVHDEKYQKRIDGLKQVEAGAVGSLQGMLITVGARRVDVATRVHILDVWHAHAASYRKVWSADDCTKLAGMVAMIQLGEKNASINEGLARLAKDLENCHGGVR